MNNMFIFSNKNESHHNRHHGSDKDLQPYMKDTLSPTSIIHIHKQIHTYQSNPPMAIEERKEKKMLRQRGQINMSLSRRESRRRGRAKKQQLRQWRTRLRLRRWGWEQELRRRRPSRPRKRPSRWRSRR